MRLATRVWHEFCKRILLIRCEYKEHLGSKYGGYTFYPAGLGKDSIVWSLGIGEDISFDLALIDKYKCHVYAFDPTPRSHAWLRSQELPEKFVWFDYGISDYDGEVKFYQPEDPEFVSYTVWHRGSTETKPVVWEVKKIASVLRILNHKKIDLLKMDIEGAEYAVIGNMIKEHIRPWQILVEFHDHMPEVSLWKTIKSVIMLLLNNYSLFNVTETGDEYSFFYKGKTGIKGDP